MPTAGQDAIPFFDEREKLLKQEILVGGFPVLGIDVEACAALGRGDDEVGELTPFAHVLDEVKSAGVDKGLLVVAETVQEIENRELPGFLLVECGGKDDAIADGAREDLAGNGVALDAAGGSGCC